MIQKTLWIYRLDNIDNKQSLAKAMVEIAKNSFEYKPRSPKISLHCVKTYKHVQNLALYSMFICAKGILFSLILGLAVVVADGSYF